MTVVTSKSYTEMRIEDPAGVVTETPLPAPKFNFTRIPSDDNTLSVSEGHLMETPSARPRVRFAPLVTCVQERVAGTTSSDRGPLDKGSLLPSNARPTVPPTPNSDNGTYLANGDCHKSSKTMFSSVTSPIDPPVARSNTAGLEPSEKALPPNMASGTTAFDRDLEAALKRMILGGDCAVDNSHRVTAIRIPSNVAVVLNGCPAGLPGDHDHLIGAVCLSETIVGPDPGATSGQRAITVFKLRSSVAGTPDTVVGHVCPAGLGLFHDHLLVASCLSTPLKTSLAHARSQELSQTPVYRSKKISDAPRMPHGILKLAKHEVFKAEDAPDASAVCDRGPPNSSGRSTHSSAVSNEHECLRGKLEGNAKRKLGSHANTRYRRRGFSRDRVLSYLAPVRLTDPGSHVGTRLIT
ncbi:hypothetical protein CALCODRAFT_511560 [Calocera cornea HHB12733]|uniref:Uncharacterized protein n=1 Tax=Calocera cornea HHB12733 TaxID=1353952 RepID=A0A165DNQ6_9BASI|nr:hypothetical protein CALCODRAFT_511560 [Calocera cornea HHB12733]